MSLVECRTADDVRALAKQRADWRRKQYAQVKQELAKPRSVPIFSLMSHLATAAPILASFGCWIVSKSRMPVIPRHLQNRIREIQEAVAKELGVNVDCMVSHRRPAREARARQVAMWFCKTRTVQSLPEIGRQFGGRDHSTVHHAVEKIEELRHSDPELAEHIERISVALG